MVKGTCPRCGSNFELPDSYVQASDHIKCPAYVICTNCKSKLRVVISRGSIDSVEIAKQKM